MDIPGKIIVSSAIVSILLGIVILGAFLWERGRIDSRASDPLYSIFAVRLAYASEHPDKGFASSLDDLEADSRGPLIDSVLASGAKSGYEFILWTSAPDSRGHALRFFVVSRPQNYREGERSYFIDQTGIERFTTENGAATAGDPPVR